MVEIKWNFRKEKEFIIKNCSQPNWADDEEEPILEVTIDNTISIAHEIQNYFIQHKIFLEKPHFGQCGDGSIDLSFDSFEKGYNILYNYYPIKILRKIIGEESLYGNNRCRNWENTKEIELKTFNNVESRAILLLFAKWCKSKRIDWEIEIERV